MTTDMLELMRMIDEVNEEKGWNELAAERDQMDWAMLAVTELAEAVEVWRKNVGPRYVWFGSLNGDRSDGLNVNGAHPDTLAEMERDAGNGEKPQGMPIEYADVLYRVLHWFAYHEIDPAAMLRIKLAYNRTRTPLHGGKRA